MKHLIAIVTLCFLILFNACIENDIPYPRIKAEILSIEVEGQLEEPVINKNDRTVHFAMNEEVDLEKVQLISLEITEDARISPNLDSTSVINLSSAQQYTLSIYQDYVWTISAEPVVDRYFKVNNQVGAEFIDVKNKVAIAYVEEGTDISSMTIQRLKLGPASATIIPKIETISDFTETGGVTVVVIYRNIREVWTLFVAEGETSTHSVDAWERVAWLSGSGRVEGDNGFEYRSSDNNQWLKLDASLIKFNDGVFSARLSGLSEGKTYISRAYSDEDYSSEVTFTMGISEQLPNPSFENWHQIKKPWLIYGENDNIFWDSGNHGSTTLSETKNVTTPVTTYVHEGNYSAQLKSDYISAVGIGKFAAGNLFSGQYVRTVGISGAILDFGRPFTKHPSKLTGWYKYEPGIINHVDDDGTLPASLIAEGAEMGKTDKGYIWIALRDAGTPFELDNTNRPDGLYHYKTDPHLIAYGELIQHTATSGNDLVRFEIELEYFHTNRTPTHILVVCSASRYGDYFVGATGSTLWLDDFELVYD